MTPTNKYGIVSFETAEELQNAGFNFKTHFCYNGGVLCQPCEIQGYFKSVRSGIVQPDSHKCPAPNFEQLLEITPRFISFEGYNYELVVDFHFNNLKYYLDRHNFLLRAENEGIYASFTDGMAEAAAKLLLLLHKYNLLPQTNTQI